MRILTMKTCGFLVVGLLSLPLAAFAWQPGAKDLDAAIHSGDFEGYYSCLTKWLDEKTPSDPGKISEEAMTKLIKDPEFRLAVDQRRPDLAT